MNTLFQYILECKVLLCDFHREQAWERWASKTANGVVAHKEELLALLRRTAHASTREEFESAVTVLENFHVWKSNKALRHWFQDTWLAEREVSFYSNHSSIKTSTLTSSLPLIESSKDGGEIEIVRVEKENCNLHPRSPC